MRAKGPVQTSPDPDLPANRDFLERELAGHRCDSRKEKYQIGLEILSISTAKRENRNREMPGGE
jgi:hypothetical protein